MKITEPEQLIDPSEGLIKCYLQWTHPFFARRLLEFSCNSNENSMVGASLLAIIHTRLPAVTDSVMKYVSFEYNNSIRKNNHSAVKFTALFFASCFRFNIISANLMYSVFLNLLGHKNQYMDVVLDLLHSCGPALDQEMPGEFTNLFTEIVRMANSRFDHDIQRFTRWRSQNYAGTVYSKEYYKYARTPYRLSVLEEYGDPLNDFLIDEITQDPTHKIHKGYNFAEFDQLYETYTEQIRTFVGEDVEDAPALRIQKEPEITNEIQTEQQQDEIQIAQQEQAEEANDDEAIQQDEEFDEEEQEDNSTQIAIEENKLKKANLEFQKTVYLTITSTATASEAAHKLVKILIEDDKILTRSKNKEKKALTQPHKRIMIETVIEYIGHNQAYDRNLAHIVRLLINAREDTQDLVEENFRRIYNNLESYKSSQIINIAALFAYLLATDSISWQVLSIIRLTPEDTNTEQRQFIRYLMERLAEGPAETSSKSWLLKKLKEPEVEAAMSGIFLTDTHEHAEIVSQFFSAINLDFLAEGVNAKIAMMSAQQQPSIELPNEYSESSGDGEDAIDEAERLRQILLAQKQQKTQEEPKVAPKNENYSASGSEDEAAERRRKHRHHRHHHSHHHHHHHRD